MRTKYFALFVVFALPTTQAVTQTKWFKYEGNPVLDVGSVGAWDNSAARIDRVIFRDSVYQAWYTGYTGGEPSLTVFPRTGYATSPDGVTWTKDSSNPVLIEGPGGWDNLGSFRPYVILSDSNYKMWYTGVAGGPIFRIGYASSLDGILWTKHPNAVLSPWASWNAGGVEHASVLEDSTSGYKAWFQGVPGFQFGFGTATDETTWTSNSNPVFSHNDWVFYPRVIFNGQFYEMWCSWRANPNSRLKYATSSDGIAWTISPENPVISPGPQAWDAGGIIPGDIHFDGSMYQMWYQGLSASRWRSGYAVSPKGMAIRVSPDGFGVSRDTVSVGDTIWVSAQVDIAAGLSFSAVFKLPSGTAVDSVVLVYWASGIFTNLWVPTQVGQYYVDLKLQRNGQDFRMNNALTFTALALVREVGTGAPQKFTLEQNYPNPFNPSTEIQFSLPRKSYVTLTIFDLLGREVATLVNEELSAGSYSTSWNATPFPSGVYFYRLQARQTEGGQAGEFSETKRLVLLR